MSIEKNFFYKEKQKKPKVSVLLLILSVVIGAVYVLLCKGKISEVPIKLLKVFEALYDVFKIIKKQGLIANIIMVIIVLILCRTLANICVLKVAKVIFSHGRPRIVKCKFGRYTISLETDDRANREKNTGEIKMIDIERKKSEAS